MFFADAGEEGGDALSPAVIAIGFGTDELDGAAVAPAPAPRATALSIDDAFGMVDATRSVSVASAGGDGGDDDGDDEEWGEFDGETAPAAAAGDDAVIAPRSTSQSIDDAFDGIGAAPLGDAALPPAVEARSTALSIDDAFSDMGGAPLEPAAVPVDGSVPVSQSSNGNGDGDEDEDDWEGFSAATPRAAGTAEDGPPESGFVEGSVDASGSAMSTTHGIHETVAGAELEGAANEEEWGAFDGGENSAEVASAEVVLSRRAPLSLTVPIVDALKSAALSPLGRSISIGDAFDEAEINDFYDAYSSESLPGLESLGVPQGEVKEAQLGGIASGIASSIASGAAAHGAFDSLPVIHDDGLSGAATATATASAVAGADDGEDDDEWGEFGGGESSAAPAAPQPPAIAGGGDGDHEEEESDDEWGDFSESTAAPSALGVVEEQPPVRASVSAAARLDLAPRGFVRADCARGVLSAVRRTEWPSADAALDVVLAALADCGRFVEAATCSEHCNARADSARYEQAMADAVAEQRFEECVQLKQSIAEAQVRDLHYCCISCESFSPFDLLPPTSSIWSRFRSLRRRAECGATMRLRSGAPSTRRPASPLSACRRRCDASWRASCRSRSAPSLTASRGHSTLRRRQLPWSSSRWRSKRTTAVRASRTASCARSARATAAQTRSLRHGRSSARRVLLTSRRVQRTSRVSRGLPRAFGPRPLPTPVLLTTCAVWTACTSSRCSCASQWTRRSLRAAPPMTSRASISRGRCSGLSARRATSPPRENQLLQ